MANPTFRAVASVAVLGAATFVAGSAKAANLVQNGDFESTSSGIGHIGKGTTLDGWTKTCLQQCGGNPLQANSYGFAFVVDDQVATRPGGGVTAYVNNGTEQLYFWGPNNTVSTSNNGFTGSPNGGRFVAMDGDFGRSTLSQSVSLDTSKVYTFSFEYAGAQQGLNATDFSGDTTQKWLVDGITASTITVGPWINPSRGFTAWQSFSIDFTPLSPNIDLVFKPFGNVVGGGEPTGVNSLPPFLLLDNVQIIEKTTPPPSPVPGPLPVLGAGVAMRLSRRLRRRIASTKPSIKA